jgi:hypothetical protein
VKEVAGRENVIDSTEPYGEDLSIEASVLEVPRYTRPVL